MILPEGYREDWTDEGLVEAWVAVGFSRENAEAKLWVLRYREGPPLD